MEVSDVVIEEQEVVESDINKSNYGNLSASKVVYTVGHGCFEIYV